MPKIEDAGNICSRRPRPTQGCRVDDDDDDDDDVGVMANTYIQNLLSENQKR
jgi:hypothetical protein